MVPGQVARGAVEAVPPFLMYAFPEMVKLTPQEERDLSDAIWKAAEGIKAVREVLASIANRLGLKWQIDNPNHIRDMAGFIANNVSVPSHSNHVARYFADDKYWKE
jgi:hypothetical protein